MADNIELEKASQRIAEGEQAGTDYIDNLESIRNELGTDGDEGATLGTMVGAQLKMTEIETQYMVESGIPKKASSANMQAAQEVKKAAG
ncbi:hypothetical protein CL658_05110 [bacterium]|nr:hypothetical protein [bacterium]|tara:strand:- start:648 stop:914 length:267 start_codon:yes stop_codon:yes gene_type:complete